MFVEGSTHLFCNLQCKHTQ